MKTHHSDGIGIAGSLRIALGVTLMAFALRSLGADYNCEVNVPTAAESIKKCKTGDKLFFTSKTLGLPPALTWAAAANFCDFRYAVVLHDQVGACIYSESEAKRLDR